MRKEEFYKMPFDLCSIMGLNFGKFEKNKKENLLTILKFGSLVNIFLTIVQEFIYFTDGRNPPIDRLRLIAFLSYMIEAFTKFLSAILQEKKIKEIIISIEEIHHSMEFRQQSILDGTAKPLRDLSQWVGISYILIIQLFNILPALIMLKIFLFGEESVHLHPFPFWYPFNANDYFVPTYIYEMMCGFFAVIAISVTDVLYLMIVSKIIGIYDVLVDSVEELINQNEVENQEKFKEIIEMHVEVNRQCDLLNDCFGIPILVHVGLASVIMCFTGFVVLTQNNIMVIVQFASVLCVALGHTFLFCWFGNKVDEKVSEKSF
jgi:hypothetical protein